jgi:membrane fusion protein (multidrug efflux system)
VNVADQNPETNGDETESSEQPKQKSAKRFIIIGVVAVLVVGALLFWWRSTFYEDTDDAQINGHLVQISSRIAGQVIKIYVDENQEVKAGDPICDLDPKDFQVAVQQDEANLQAAEAAYESAKVNVPITGISTGSNLRSTFSDVEGSEAQVAASRQQLTGAIAQIAQADANYTKAKLDLERYKPLVEKDVISKQQFDQAVATADADKAALDNAKANEAAARAQVKVAEDRVKTAQAQHENAQSAPQQVAAQKAKADQAAAQVEQARAQLEQAKLNLSYTKIIAPEAGIITRKSVEINQNVSVGQNLMTLVSLDDIWITANFKETQLQHMKAGQTGEISVDAYGGRKYDVKVTQIGGATGSVLSLFPPENATGNYVKVVQRVPVRLDLFDPKAADPKNENKDHLLRPGLSVEPKIRVKE